MPSSKPTVIKQGGQSVTPATLSTIRPGTPVVQLSPQEEDVLNEVARTQGVDKAEAMRRIMERMPPAPQPKPTVTEQSLSKIEQARELSLTSDDPNDPLNQMMRYGFYKDLRKDFKKGDEERMSTREMMEMAILQRMLPSADNGNQSASAQQIINDMRAENEKQRQFYEQKLKEQDDKIRDMIFEKRIQTMEEKQVETINSMSQQLSDLGQRIELYQNIPPNPSPAETKDAITHLEDAGKDLDRIKGVLSKFGLIPASQSPPIPATTSSLSTPGVDIYKKQDGTTDYFRFAIDKLESTVGKVTDAWQKKTPDMKQVAETPPPEETKLIQQSPQTERALTPEEYADALMSKPRHTLEEQQWLARYSAYLRKLQSKVQPRTRVLYKPQDRRVEQPAGPAEPADSVYEQPVEQPANQADPVDGQTEPVYEQPEEQPQRRKSALDKLREQEEEIIKNTQGIL